MKIFKYVPIWAVISMALVIFVSNILVTIMVDVNLMSPFNNLTWGAFTFPASFLITDLTNRLYGSLYARRVVYIGFIVGVIISLLFNGSNILNDVFMLNVPEEILAANAEERMLFQVSLVQYRWIALAAGSAFLISQLLDILIFSKLRKVTSEWFTPLASSTIASIIDKLIFFFIAFYGIEGLNWQMMALADWLAAIFITIILLPVYLMIIKKYRTRQYKLASA